MSQANLDALLFAAVELAEEGQIEAAQTLLQSPVQMSLEGTRQPSAIELAMEDGIVATSLLAEDLRERVAAIAKKKYPLKS